MNLNKIPKHPLIKIVGISIIIYFALFYNKRDSRSLGNRLSSTNIKKSISSLRDQGSFIAKNIKTAKKLQNQSQENYTDDESSIENSELSNEQESQNE